MKYIITKEELLRLLESDLTLNGLYNGGVDNWKYYDEAIDGMGDVSGDAEAFLSKYKTIDEEPTYTSDDWSIAYGGA